MILTGSSSAFQGDRRVSISPSSISEKFESHIYRSRRISKPHGKRLCSVYWRKNSCQKLLDGTEYCGSSYSYVPPYCYAGSTVKPTSLRKCGTTSETSSVERSMSVIHFTPSQRRDQVMELREYCKPEGIGHFHRNYRVSLYPVPWWWDNKIPFKRGNFLFSKEYGMIFRMIIPDATTYVENQLWVNSLCLWTTWISRSRSEKMQWKDIREKTGKNLPFWQMKEAKTWY